MVDVAQERVAFMSDPQSMVYTSLCALNLNMAGQRSGKSQMIGVMSGEYVLDYPTLKGFIGANTYMQLSQSTLIKCFEIWRKEFGMTPYDRKSNKGGHYVVNKRPPSHFKTNEVLPDYNNTISFFNGALIFTGSLDNWQAHDGKEFAWAHLDETKDTKKEAVTGVILARLSQSGLYISPDGDLVYLPEAPPNSLPDHNSFNPSWIHTSPSPAITPEWLLDMFNLKHFEKEIKEEITRDEGMDFFYREFDNKSVTIYSTYHNEGNLPNGYIAGRKRILAENEQLKLIYGYPFSKIGSEFYPHFSTFKHVRKIEAKTTGLKHVTFDFNVMPYMTMLVAQVSYKTRYIDDLGEKHDEPGAGRVPIEVTVVEFTKEYCLKSPLNTTEHCCNNFIQDEAGNMALEVFYYGDASGNNRIPGLGAISNFSIIEEVLDPYIFDGSKKVRGANIGVLTRRNLINKILEGKIPEIEIYFDEDMTETIRDFEYVKLGPEGKVKEKEKDESTGIPYEKIGHTSDAAEYLICELFRDYILKN